ncbi:MAG: ribosome recycling factor [Proteobacteria bacterium]|nr:ribosome recycling factor [Pseudomonadota bacterium]NCA28539.1 ribosome recycling factor [Pseudomonadota bacterium]
MINQLVDKARKKMDETISSLKRDLDSISTGRASPNLLDTIRVEVYGQFMPISQLASISVPEATTLAIQAWDKDSVKAIEKAIINSNLGFNPTVDGTLLRINIPKLSEERRKDLVKLAKKYGEDKKIALRNIRRDVLDDFKKNEKEIGASKDQIHGFTDIIQKITDEFVAKVDQMVDLKEKDLLKI